jgi:hypothetical protein
MFSLLFRPTLRQAVVTVRFLLADAACLYRSILMRAITMARRSMWALVVMLVHPAASLWTCSETSE